MKYRIFHNTIYEYSASAESCHNLVRLHPRLIHSSPHAPREVLASHSAIRNPQSAFVQSCLDMQLTIDPVPASLHSYDDYFGNRVHSFAIYQPHLILTIIAESQVSIEPRPQLDLAATIGWQETAEWLRSVSSPSAVEALEYVFDSPYIRTSDLLGGFAAEHFPPGRPLGEAALALTAAIYRDFHYDPKATTIDTSVEDVLDKRRGVCQDFAHLAIACLRSLGLACRYVSGYLRTDPQPGQPRLIGADASHAWISVYSPEVGWIDLDPTNGCVVSDRHITLGWGRDFHDVSPVKGSVLGGGESTLRVAVDVAPIE